MIAKERLDRALREFMRNPRFHKTDCDEYKNLNIEIQQYLNQYSVENKIRFDLMGFDITIGRTSFGSVSTTDLFSLFELIPFAFYKANLQNRVVADIGSNVGVHSIAMACARALRVDAYEPDHEQTELHFDRNLCLNALDKKTVRLESVAISDYNGASNFVRTLGNTTSSHLTGLKKPHGDLSIFPVAVRDIRDIVEKYSFIKIDAEGAELGILRAIPISMFKDGLECFVEIGDNSDEGDLQIIFERFKAENVYFFTQANSWQVASKVTELPKGWSDGNCFVSCKPPVFL